VVWRDTPTSAKLARKKRSTRQKRGLRNKRKEETIIMTK
jgi:hypothetical protein